MSFHDHGRRPLPGETLSPPARFGFLVAVSDLVRLVLRSGAVGLKRRLALALGLVVAGKLTGVIAPLFLQGAIDHLNRGRSPGQAMFTAFAALVLGWVALRFVAGATPYVRDAVFTPVSQKALARSAVESFAHALSLSVDFHQSKRSGALSRTIDRGARSTDFLLRSVVFNLGPTALELVMAAAVLANRFNWRLAAVALVTVALYSVFTFAISDWRIGHRRALNDADSEAAGLAVDALMNFETIKAFGAETRVVSQYDLAMGGYVKAAVKANTSLQLLNAIQSVVLNLGMVTVTLMAGQEVLAHRMSLGGLTACILILQQVYSPLFSLGMNYREIRQAFIDMEQMLELLAVAPEIVDVPGARSLPPAAAQGADLVFDHVEFRHSARSVGLSDISFRIAPGASTALVGPSGAGKTTIARLALRLIDPQSGAVRLDGSDLREVRLADLRAAVALVPQDVALFNDTLWANIAFGAPMADEAGVWAAAEAAELTAFIRSLPQGMTTRVGERGLKLSGGERQRVGIARALLANPRLLILDEATSALDGATEAAIQATLRKVRAGRTSLVIAHRLSTIIDADEILVVRRGRIVERGGHEALLAQRGEYAALWRRQTRGDADRARARAFAMVED